MDKTPIDEHEEDYIPNIWKEYSAEELMWWVHLYTKRATHRSNKYLDNIEKDIYDARNYLWMLEQKLKMTDVD